MGREIKFRAWDKVNEQWSGDLLYIDESGDLYEIEERSRAYQTYMHRECVNERYDVVWFTGFRDKNGVEIYEGHVLKSHTGLTGCVQWDNTTHTYRVRWFKVPGSELHIVASWCEIIGNVYEHPHLLKEAAGQ